MSATVPEPAAQYLRMSTEHQQYSLKNQAAEIQRYADANGLQIVETYADAGKSGLDLKHRPELKRLLKDVCTAGHKYAAILVRDVSRWGRFLDIDESAHYEFVCRSAGVKVHYCAEPFNDGVSLPNLLMKVLKRAMACEYSRDLGDRVLAGQRRAAQWGFKQGGIPGYGLRRLLVTADREPKQQLEDGERKSLVSDRVILVPGPAHEVACIRQIYRMLVAEGRSVYSIARELNRRQVPFLRNWKWHHHSVQSILTNPKYTGCCVYGRTTIRLHTPTVKKPKSDWIVTPDAYEPLIDEGTFNLAQQILGRRTIGKSDEEVLQALRSLLETKKKLTAKIVANTPELPSPSTYRTRFGGMLPAYKLIGYDGQSKSSECHHIRCRTALLREGLFQQITMLFQNEVSIFRPNRKWRQFLRLNDGTSISVIVARAVQKDVVRQWQIDPVERERHHITLIAKSNSANDSISDYYLFPRLDRQHRFTVTDNDPWLGSGKRLSSLSNLLQAVSEIRSTR